MSETPSIDGDQARDYLFSLQQQAVKLAKSHRASARRANKLHWFSLCVTLGVWGLLTGAFSQGEKSGAMQVVATALATINLICTALLEKVGLRARALRHTNLQCQFNAVSRRISIALLRRTLTGADILDLTRSMQEIESSDHEPPEAMPPRPPTPRFTLTQNPLRGTVSAGHMSAASMV